MVFIKGHTTRVWNSIINYRYKENRSQTGEDAKEQFHKENDHGVDSLGYGIMPIPLDLEEQDKTRHRFKAVKPRAPEDDVRDLYEEDEGLVTLYGVPV